MSKKPAVMRLSKSLKEDYDSEEFRATAKRLLPHSLKQAGVVMKMMGVTPSQKPARMAGPKRKK